MDGFYLCKFSNERRHNTTLEILSQRGVNICIKLSGILCLIRIVCVKMANATSLLLTTYYKTT